MTPSSTPTGPDLALAAAAAAAEVLPSVDPLIAAGAQPGNEHVTAAFSGAVVAEIDGPRPGRIAILVGEELTSALASSPIDGLDLGAATQPALDAAAAVLGGSARAARTTDLSLVVSDLGEPFTVVPLIGAGIAASVLVQDHLLEPAAAEQSPEESYVESPLTADVAAPEAPAAPAAAAPAEQASPFAQAAAPAGNVTAFPRRGIEMLHGVDMEVTVELGRTRMTVRDLLALTPGAVLELDRAAGSPADLLVNGRLIARGEVVVVDEDFGLRLTEIIDDSAVG
ncbi:flagellar motor switch protein FliN [Marmoricola sp. RAF53]|uniref:flagellar motor switch protein FliN n=1 Tax=Marmoricola sp. RAF53 TaxID=3233059 RepID=UPI003F94857F